MRTITRILSRASNLSRRTVDYEKLIPVVEFVAGIPRNIVQTCRCESDLPDEILANIQAICAVNSGWDYHLYDDGMVEDYIVKYYGPEIYGYYKRISPQYGAARADMFRYLYIYREGGVYLDIKSSVSEPFDRILRDDDSFLLAYWDNLEGQAHQGVGHYTDKFQSYCRGEIPQWFIIASKGHRILRDIIIQVLKNIDNYNPYIDGIGWSGTVNTTGPVPYSLIIYSNIGNYQYREVDSYKELNLLYSIYENSNPDSTFHAKAIKSDYRKGRCPVIRHNCLVLELLNRMWINFLCKYAER